MTTLSDELRRLAGEVTRVGWTLDSFGNICIGLLPLFKQTGAKDEDSAMIVLLRNNLDTIITALEAQDPTPGIGATEGTDQ